ncbi:hypothetical protein AAP_03620 [Ascosphaera apis ARSEF 7405]|uniref:Methyltransferase domain-containing protein n=1 Tax=Ascosphaera apis ARSEF 7405 TaxID=392613 RepID=A0A167Y892_9EURO|nr:hypothetical protein AAP_03620 [Ascosphaera apis ARSEF 7405]
MTTRRPLPIPDEWASPDDYVQSLLSFATQSNLFRNFAGGIHILDFLTREPDLYTTVVPEDWRNFFDQHAILDILDLFLREPIDQYQTATKDDNNGQKGLGYRDGPAPPTSLIEYIHQIRRHNLQREFTPQPDSKFGKIPPHVAIGMKPKKMHEVENFSRFVNAFADDVHAKRGEAVSHIVDFGSGQNYLGRNLASPPYNRKIIAIERRHHNIHGAMGKDVHAKLKLKKAAKKGAEKQEEAKAGDAAMVCDEPVTLDRDENGQPTAVLVASEKADRDLNGKMNHLDLGPSGSVEYIEHDIQDGYLEPIIQHVVNPSHPLEDAPLNDPARVMVISLHSCGNLVHHGIRSFVLNPSVVAIAMIGCCYNLMTERLGPVTYKLPTLRSMHPRLEATSNAYDPHGFPMSKTMEDFEHEGGKGIKCNITARMMAVQAPYNWGPEDSEGFFTRHFFRALLQRVFVDYGIIPVPVVSSDDQSDVLTQPLIVGSLRKASMTSFVSYARAALNKLVRDEHYGDAIAEKLVHITDEELQQYADKYAHKKKALSIIWSLMAFSASIVESLVVTDRWLFLREQKELIKEAWVEPVFEYAWSPRNLAVIGIKR